MAWRLRVLSLLSENQSSPPASTSSNSEVLDLSPGQSMPFSDICGHCTMGIYLYIHIIKKYKPSTFRYKFSQGKFVET